MPATHHPEPVDGGGFVSQFTDVLGAKGGAPEPAGCGDHGKAGGPITTAVGGMWGDPADPRFGPAAAMPQALLSALRGGMALHAPETRPGLLRPVAPIRIEGASSPAGEVFARRAERSLALPGGLGARGLTQAWSQVTDPAEKTALRAGIDKALTARITELSTTVAGADGRPASPRTILALQEAMRGIRDLEAVAGVSQHKLTPEAVQAIRARLSRQVEQLERQGDSLAMQGSAGFPLEMMDGLTARVDRLGKLVGLVDDPRLKARLDAILPQVAGAASAMMQVDQIDQLGELTVEDDSEQTAQTEATGLGPQA